MTPEEFAVDVVRHLTQAGFIAYWAGGCVRDLLMGREPDDHDVATDATPEQVRNLFGRRRTLPVGESFGVIIVLGPTKSVGQIEVATFRTEGEYKDGRRPESVRFSSPEEDAQRRDFTINGMFYDPLTGTVHDFVGGQHDLDRRIIRAIGDPRARMREDKLRMLRAARFAAILDFDLDEETAAAIGELSADIVLVSAERIAQELRKMLTHVHRARAMQLCRDLNLLKLILPEVEEQVRVLGEQSWESLRRILDELGNASFEQAMAVLHRDVPSSPEKRSRDHAHHGTVQAACRRLKLSNDELERISRLVEHAGSLQDAPKMPLRQLKRLAIEPYLEDLLHVEGTVLRVAGDDCRPVEFLRKYVNETPAEMLNPPELLTGRDLIALGYKPGPRFKEWLQAIRDAQLDERISTREEALALLSMLTEGRDDGENER